LILQIQEDPRHRELRNDLSILDLEIFVHKLSLDVVDQVLPVEVEEVGSQGEDSPRLDLWDPTLDLAKEKER